MSLPLLEEVNEKATGRPPLALLEEICEKATGRPSLDSEVVTQYQQIASNLIKRTTYFEEYSMCARYVWGNTLIQPVRRPRQSSTLSHQ